MLKSTELAEALGVSKNTVLRLANEGHIPATRLPGGHYRFDLDEVKVALRAAKDGGDDA
jgi:excisionase family DNA binding protein